MTLDEVPFKLVYQLESLMDLFEVTCAKKGLELVLDVQGTWREQVHCHTFGSIQPRFGDNLNFCFWKVHGRAHTDLQCLIIITTLSQYCRHLPSQLDKCRLRSRFQNSFCY
jgi:hypothetical protein